MRKKHEFALSMAILELTKKVVELRMEQIKVAKAAQAQAEVLKKIPNFEQIVREWADAKGVPQERIDTTFKFCKR